MKKAIFLSSTLLILVFAVGLLAYPFFAKVEAGAGHGSSRSYKNPESIKRKKQLAEKRQKSKDLCNQARFAWKKDNDLEQAEQLYRRALEVDPHSRITDYNLAQVLYEAGKHKEALQFYDKVVNPSKDGSSLQTNGAVLARYLELCELLGEEKKALKAQEKLVGLYLDKWSTLFPEALEAKTPNDLKAFARIAQGLGTKGEKGLAFLRSARDMLPDSPVPYYFLAHKIEALKAEANQTPTLQQYIKAKDSYKKVMKLCSNNPEGEAYHFSKNAVYRLENLIIALKPKEHFVKEK